MTIIEVDKQALRDRIVAAARSCIGTPWHHQARLPGVGMDCVGLLVYALSSAGIEVRDETNYQRRGETAKFRDWLTAHGCVQISKDEMAPGDLVLFTIEGRPQHSGIVSAGAPEMRYLHVPIVGTGCREDPLTPAWAAQIHSAWRLAQLA